MTAALIESDVAQKDRAPLGRPDESPPGSSGTHTGSEQRRAQRVPYRSLARLQFGRGDDGFEAEVLNLSATGMFVVADHVPAAGAAVECHVFLGLEPWVLRGKVAWVRPDWRPGGTRAPAAGIEFLDLTRRDEAALGKAVSDAAASQESPAAIDPDINAPPPDALLRALSSSSAARVAAFVPPARFEPRTGATPRPPGQSRWLVPAAGFVMLAIIWWSWTPTTALTSAVTVVVSGPRAEPPPALLVEASSIEEAPALAVDVPAPAPAKASPTQAVAVNVAPIPEVAPAVKNAAEATPDGVVLVQPDWPFSIRVMPRAAVVIVPLTTGRAAANARPYGLTQPPGIALNLPGATQADGVRGRYTVGQAGIRSVWVEMRDAILHVRVLTAAGVHSTLHVDPTRVRVIVRP